MGYNVQVAVETKHHLIITHEVTDVRTDRSQLASVAKKAKATLKVENLDAVADRGYFNSEEILACERQALGHAAEADDLELTRVMLLARTCRAISAATRGSVFIRNWVAPCGL